LRRATASRALSAAACLFVVLAAPPAASPADVNLDPAAIADAVRIGRSSQADLDRFHAAYRVDVDDAVIRRLEIVSEFRRLVQLTEERERLRDVTWDASRAAVAAREFRGRLDLVLDLAFSPANTFRTVPNYSLAVYRRGPARALAPIDSWSNARYVAAQPAPPGTPILGATVTATFDASRLDLSSPCLVGIFLDGKEVRRVSIDLASVR
jgi:hypothetical protein